MSDTASDPAPLCRVCEQRDAQPDTLDLRPADPAHQTCRECEDEINDRSMRTVRRLLAERAHRGDDAA